jgi:hypothetical protein
MKYEMEMAEEIYQQMEELNEFIESVKQKHIHYAFPFSYHKVIMILLSIEDEPFMLEKINQIPNLTVYQKGRQRWFYIIRKSSGYENKVRMQFLLHKEISIPNSCIYYYLSYLDKIKDLKYKTANDIIMFDPFFKKMRAPKNSV